MTAHAEIRTCGNCGRRVCCEYDGDAYVGQCTWCGEFKAYQYCPKPDADEPAPQPKLLGVQVDYWEDEGRRDSQSFDDPDEGCAFAE